MTNVTRTAGRGACFLLVLAAYAFSQTAEAGQGSPQSFYLRLRSVGLDKTRVFKIRDGALDRGPIHFSFDDGTIAFTQDVEGHVTGALFLGEGDILLRPPNAAERTSLALFTGAAILEEDISLAYLRFNDDVYSELRPSLRAPSDDPESFVALWDSTAKELAQEDALRLLIGFSQGYSSSSSEQPTPDHMLHAYLRGRRLGTFDVRYDSTVPEQIFVGQHQTVAGANYYNVWLSFALARPRKPSDVVSLPAPDFEITQFNIHAQIKPPTQLSAHADLAITPLRSGTRVLLFELSRLLQVQSVEANGRTVEFIHNQAIEGSQLARRGNDALAVFLPSALEKGKVAHLTFQYSGAVLSEAANGLLSVGEHGTWYPNIGLKMSWFNLQFRYPLGWILVATGKPGETKVDGEEQVSHWTSERPVPVAGFNLGKYSRAVTRAGNVNIETYATSNVEKGFPRAAGNELPLPDLLPKRPFGPEPTIPLPPPPPSPSENVEMVGATAARALDFYQQNFGPFPYDRLVLTQFPGDVSQGWPGLIFLSTYAFLSPSERERVEPDRTARLIQEQVIAHETAHQWWGDLVGWSGYRDQWIMEGLANYSALMLLETRNPAGFHQILRKYRDDLLDKNSEGKPLMDAGPVTFGLRLSSSEFPSAYDAISYGRGTWLFHMLRTMLQAADRKPGEKSSDELFMRALRNLRTEYEGKTVTTTEMMRVFEAELPRSLWYEDHKSLDWFLDGWVNGSAVPHFELRDLKFADRRSTTAVSGTIVQDDAPDTLVTAVPLYASIAGKDVFLGRVFAEGRETTFRLSAPLHARKVLLDPDQTLLSRNNK